jgi:hypothetical protein
VVDHDWVFRRVLLYELGVPDELGDSPDELGKRAEGSRLGKGQFIRAALDGLVDAEGVDDPWARGRRDTWSRGVFAGLAETLIPSDGG